MAGDRKRLYLALFAVNALIVLINVLDVGIMAWIELPLFILLMGLTGIPHGATDYYVYRFCQQSESIGLWPFIRSYLTAMAFFMLLWICWPPLSLGIFVLLAAYHLGKPTGVESHHSGIDF